MSQPELISEDLVLRALTPEDAPAVQLLAGDERIADTTANIPHPYPDGEAERWLASVAIDTQAGTQVSYAICLADTGELVGCVSLMHIAEREAEIGYWVGVRYWGRGIATQAVRGIVDYGLGVMGLRRIHARVLSRNAASGKVLLKLGFTHLGNQPTTCGYRQEVEPCDYFEMLAA